MKKFAKIFEVENSQVLITKEYDSEDETHNLVQRTDFDTYTQELKLSFKSEESRDKAFDDFNASSAETIFKRLKSLLNETE